MSYQSGHRVCNIRGTFSSPARRTATGDGEGFTVSRFDVVVGRLKDTNQGVNHRLLQRSSGQCTDFSPISRHQSYAVARWESRRLCGEQATIGSRNPDGAISRTWVQSPACGEPFSYLTACLLAPISTSSVQGRPRPPA